MEIIKKIKEKATVAKEKVKTILESESGKNGAKILGFTTLLGAISLVSGNVNKKGVKKGYEIGKKDGEAEGYIKGYMEANKETIEYLMNDR